MARTTTRSRRVATVVPLALVSVAWTTHVGGTTTLTAAAPTTDAPTTRPGPVFGPTTAPGATEALDVPASLSTPAEVTAGDGRFTTVAARPTSSDIPATALAAYQRAETVINAADPSCGLSWQLLAAIGRIESDHGRFGGATLRTDGVSTPSIIGPVLDGTRGNATVRDTDAGQYDGDTRYDRAVGPLQFIPSTWSVVGVDADNDGARNPLDIDDAALAAAVYLCSGTDDLTKAPGQRLAVFRYNHSSAYVDLVLSVMGGYLQGDDTTSPDPVLSARSRDVGPLVPVAGAGTGLRAVGQPAVIPAVASAEPVASSLVSAPAASAGTPAPAAPVEPAAPAEPTTPAEPTSPTTPAEPTSPTTPAEPSSPTTPADPTDPAQPTAPPTGPVPVEPELGTLTPEDAATYCGDDLALVDDPARADDDFDTCVADYSLPVED